MKRLLLAIKKQRDLYKNKTKKTFSAMRLRAYERCYDEIIMLGLWHPDNIKLPEQKMVNEVFESRPKLRIY